MRGDDERVFVLCHTKLITLANGDRVSLGAVLCAPDREHVFEKVYQRADATMYTCKKVTGNSYDFYTGGTPHEYRIIRKKESGC